MTQPNQKFIFTQQELVGRPKGWTGDMLAGIYPIDVEYAVFEHLGKDHWTNWRTNHPTQLDEVVNYIRERMVANLVIDANLDEYVNDALKEISEHV